jgi:hypothetical protein
MSHALKFQTHEGWFREGQSYKMQLNPDITQVSTKIGQTSELITTLFSYILCYGFEKAAMEFLMERKQLTPRFCDECDMMKLSIS